MVADETEGHGFALLNGASTACEGEVASSDIFAGDV